MRRSVCFSSPPMPTCVVMPAWPRRCLTSTTGSTASTGNGSWPSSKRTAPVCLDVEAGVQLALVGRYYERLGDHAVNIGNRVVYLVTGWLPENTRRSPPSGPRSVCGQSIRSMSPTHRWARRGRRLTCACW